MTWYGCHIIKQTAHNGIMTWVIMPDAVNILQKRTIAVITSYRDTQSTIPGAQLLTDVKQHFCPQANGINSHLVQKGATELKLGELQHLQLGSDIVPKVLWALLCTVLQPVYDCNWQGNSNLVGFWIHFLQVWIAESGPTLALTYFKPSKSQYIWIVVVFNTVTKKSLQRQKTGSHKHMDWFTIPFVVVSGNCGLQLVMLKKNYCKSWHIHKPNRQSME